MNLKEAIKTLNAYINAIDTFGTIDPRCCNNLYEPAKTILQELDNLQKGNKELMNEYHKRVQERIDIEQELKDSISKDEIDLPIKLIEGHFEKIEEYCINHWKNHFAYVEQDVAVKNIRRLIGEIKDLLKEEWGYIWNI